MDRSSERKKWKKETSVGGLVFRDEGREVLLIEPAYPDRKGLWTFPKGWTSDHKGETREDTALREVREEGGVEARISEDLGEVHYLFTFEGVKVSKTVHYFLMEYVSGDPKDHDLEVSEAKFVPVSEAIDMLAYKTDREMFQMALDKLKGTPA